MSVCESEGSIGSIYTFDCIMDQGDRSRLESRGNSDDDGRQAKQDYDSTSACMVKDGLSRKKRKGKKMRRKGADDECICSRQHRETTIVHSCPAHPRTHALPDAGCQETPGAGDACMEQSRADHACQCECECATHTDRRTLLYQYAACIAFSIPVQFSRGGQGPETDDGT